MFSGFVSRRGSLLGLLAGAAAAPFAASSRGNEEDAKWVFSLYYIELMP